MATLRTPQTEKKYQEKKQDPATRTRVFNPEAEEVLREFNYWFLIPNKFPYDLIAEKHHMLIPKRVFGELGEANEAELAELAEIKRELGPEYHYIIETTSARRSIGAHLHLHFILIKENLSL